MNKFKIVLFVAIAFNACKNSNEQSSQNTNRQSAEPDAIALTYKQIEMMQIGVGPSSERLVSERFQANGTVAVLPQNRAAVSAKLPGRIESVHVHEGQNVRKGQLLFRISNTQLVDIQQAYLHAKADLLFLEKERERQKNLQASSAGASKNLEEVESRYLRARADLESNAAKLKYLNTNLERLDNPEHLYLSPVFDVYAPIDGNVTEIPASIGQMVTEGMLLCHVVNANEHLHAHVEVFAQYAAQIREGQSVLIHFPGGQHPDMQSAVEYISRELNTDTKTVSLHVPLPDGKGIVPGMPLTALIEQSGVKSATLPESAMLMEGETHYGFVVMQKDSIGMVFKKIPLRIKGHAEGYWGIDLPENGKKEFALRGASILDGALKKDIMQE